MTVEIDGIREPEAETAAELRSAAPSPTAAHTLRARAAEHHVHAARKRHHIEAFCLVAADGERIVGYV
jgi:hypothetical protein